MNEKEVKELKINTITEFVNLLTEAVDNLKPDSLVLCKDNRKEVFTNITKSDIIDIIDTVAIMSKK